MSSSHTSSRRMSSRRMSALSLIRRRRAALADYYDVRRQFKELEESCVPSYLHANPAAAAVAWWRLFAAANLVRAHAPRGPLLDFGAASGELAQVLKATDRPLDYHYVEQDEVLAGALRAFLPQAQQRSLDDLGERRFSCIAALDSLEHNENVAAIVGRLIAALAEDGVLVLSGPTENRLYRLGRKVAGFSGDYHTTTIFEIERIVAGTLERMALRRIPLPGLCLFRVSAWRRKRQP